LKGTKDSKKKWRSGGEKGGGGNSWQVKIGPGKEKWGGLSEGNRLKRVQGTLSTRTWGKQRGKIEERLKATGVIKEC